MRFVEGANPHLLTSCPPAAPKGLPAQEEDEEDEVDSGRMPDPQGVERQEELENPTELCLRRDLFEAELDRALRDARAKILSAAQERQRQPHGARLASPRLCSDTSAQGVQRVGTGDVVVRHGSSGARDQGRAARRSVGERGIHWEDMRHASDTVARARVVKQGSLLSQMNFSLQGEAWLRDRGLGSPRNSWRRKANADHEPAACEGGVTIDSGNDCMKMCSSEFSSSPKFPSEKSKLQQVMNSIHSRSLVAPDVRSQETLGSSRRASLAHIRKLVQHPAFDVLMSVFIVFDLIAVGWTADREEAEGIAWDVVDAVFALIYTLELILKWTSYGLCHYFRSAPFVHLNRLDFVLLVLHVSELSIGRFLLASNDSSRFFISCVRILRLVRVGRILHLVRLPIFNELTMMLDGAQGGLRTLFWSQVLIALFLYVVALIFRVLVRDFEHLGSAHHFESLSESYFTVFRCLVANDCNDSLGRPIFVSIAQEHGWHFAAIYCAASVLMIFGLFNVIVGIYVENTVAAARCNKNRLKQERLHNKRIFEAKVYELVDFILESGIATGGVRRSLIDTAFVDLKGISLTLDMLEDLRAEARFQEILRDLDIADEDQLDLFDTLDVNGSGEVDLEELVQAIGKLRGGARRSDIVSVGLMVRNLQFSISQLESAVKARSSSRAPSPKKAACHGEVVDQSTVVSFPETGPALMESFTSCSA